MFTTFIAFFITGVIFIILHFFINGVWPYYVPAALMILASWLKIMQPAWNADNFQMPVIKMDPSAAGGYLWMIAVIYGIVSLIFGFWIPLIICVIVFILSLTMKFPHPY